MVKKLYVFGNIGKLSKGPADGGQSSARRVMKGIERAGFTVVPVVRHKTVSTTPLGHSIETKLFALVDLLRIVALLLPASRNNSAFIHLTYGGDLLPFEYLISKVVRAMGFRMLTYMKGGQFMEYYNTGSDSYRDLYRKTFELQTQAWFEGSESMEIVNSICDIPTVLLPNYVFDEEIPPEVTKRPADRLNLCYFGRIAPSKNVTLIIDIFNELCRRHPEAQLTIVGDDTLDKEYTRLIDEHIAASPFCGNITRHELMTFTEIKEMLRSQHFFLFPTAEKCEGHSNSLNEAMSQGVIPIVSNWHFNASVAGDPLLVVEGFEPTKYAERIELLLEKPEKLETLSQEVHDRIALRFSYTKAHEIIRKALEEI